MSLFGRLFGGSPPPPPPDAPLAEPALSFARGMESLQAKTAFHDGSWGLGGARWDVDLDTGVITFTNQRGWTITAPVQVIGTVNTADGTWLWGWDHPSVRPAQARDAELVRAFGERHGLAELTTRTFPASDADGWRFTGLATYLADAQGAYRGPTGAAHVFMTFGEVSIRQA